MNFDRSHTDVWQFSDGGNDGSRFWRDLFLNNSFDAVSQKGGMNLSGPGSP